MSTTTVEPTPVVGPSERARRRLTSDPASTGAPGAGTPAEVLPPAAAPVGVAAAAWLSIVLCLGLVALGVLALREVLVGREVAGQVLVPGQPWVEPLLAGATALVPGTTAVVAGAAGLVLGLLLLVAALRPRPARTVRLPHPAATGVPLDLEPDAVADLAAQAALGEAEVLTSRARADRRSVTVRVGLDPRDDHDARAVAASTTERVTGRLDGLRPAPRVRTQVSGAKA